jgi:outer membrane biosynthesis protein TonB
MQPWKMFIRSAGVVTVLTAGALAAGQAVVPFSNVSRGVSPTVEEPAPEEEIPVVDPAEEAPETDDSTTTTTEPEAPATDETDEADEPADDPIDDPIDDPAPAEVPEESAVTPIDVDAVAPAPIADAAPKANKAKKAKKVKGDHNCDGHPDNGWMKHVPKGKTYPTCDTAAAPADPAPASAAAPAAASGNNGRSESAKEDGDNGRSESAKQDGDNGRSASAPGRMKKGL